MKNLMIVLFLLFTISRNYLISQESFEVSDKIILKSGEIFEGHIVKYFPNKYIKIKLSKDVHLMFKYENISNYNGENNPEGLDHVKLINGLVLFGTITENLPDNYIKLKIKKNTIVDIPFDNINNPVPLDVLTKFVLSENQDLYKMMLYESEKKTPAVATIFSLLLPSAGHAYADNWGRGLAFTAGKIGCYFVAIDLGIKTNEETIGSGYYKTKVETVEITNAYYIGLAGMVVLSVYEAVDSYKEAEKFNKNLLKKILDTESVGINFVPTKNGTQLQLSYNF